MLNPQIQSGDCGRETPDPPPPMHALPRQIKYIVGNEACERVSYYGMLSILTLYLKNVMAMGESGGKELAHLFMTAVYFLPLLGGWLADRWLGRYWTILILSLFYCLGHGALALFEGSRPGLFLGLTLIAIGAGGVKPCVSAFVGDQFEQHEERALTKVYGLFYWCINIGAALGFALIPLIRDHAGYRWAFGVPGIFMAIATLLFWAGRKKYVRQPPTDSHSGLLKSENRKAVAGIVVIFAAIPMFWALFNQVFTTWVIQAEKMVPFHVFGFKVDAERMQSSGAILVLIWVPILTLWVYPLAERLGLRPTPLRRMTVGMALGAFAFVISALIQSKIDHGQSLSIAWQILPYIVLEAGEVMLSATALEFAFAQAPASMKSIIMSFWLLTMALGNFLVASFTSLNRNFVHARGAAEFYFYAALMFAVTGLFAVLTTRYRPATAGHRGAA